MFARTSILSIIFVVGFSVLIGCTSREFSQVDRFVEDAKERSDMVSGTAVIVIKGDRIIHEAYFGQANVATEKSVDENTVFYIASTTKAFLALAVLLAEEQGDLSRDTTLQALFPILNFEHIDADTITVKHLLTHTSGIDNESLTWAASYTGLHDDALRHEMIEASYPSTNARLGDFEYSNIGYNILVTWFDDHYGKDWRQTMKETVLTPLDIERASGFISEGKKLGWAMAEPYSYKVNDGKAPVYLRKTDKTMYSVGLIATARDTAKFLIAQANDGMVDGKQVFPSSIIQEQRRQQVETDGGYFDGYAWGWMTGGREGHSIRLHTGGYAGASALLSYMPDEKIGLVVLHNENGLKANYLSGIIEDAVYDKMLDKPEEEIATLIDPKIERLAERAAEAKQQLADEMTARQTADWRLSFNPAEYAGNYKHPHSGEIKVTLSDSKHLKLSWGLLRGTGYPHSETDMIVVDFRPGSFDPLSFEVDTSGILALIFNGVRFVKGE